MWREASPPRRFRGKGPLCVCRGGLVSEMRESMADFQSLQHFFGKKDLPAHMQLCAGVMTGCKSTVSGARERPKTHWRLMV